MPEEMLVREPSLSDLSAYRMMLAALEAEKARLVAKYDARIAGLQKAIAELEQKVPPANSVAPAKPTKRPRKGSQMKPPV